MGTRYSIQGLASPGAIITVYEADGVMLAEIFAAQTGGVADADSQISADVYGKVLFYVDSDTYPIVTRFDIKATKTGFADVWAYDVWSSFYALSSALASSGAGAPTFGDLRPQIQRNWGRSDSASQASILFYFNAALRVLSRAHNLEQLQKSKSFDFVVGDDDYTILSSPISLTDLRKIYSFTYIASSRGIALEYLPTRQWDLEIAPRIPSAGNNYPRYYTQWGNDLLIYPPPNDTYTATLRYLAEPTLAGDTSTTIDYVGMDEVLVLLTTAFCFFSTEDVEMGNIYLKQAANMLKMYGIEAATPVDFRPSTGASSQRAVGDTWLDPFVKR